MHPREILKRKPARDVKKYYTKYRKYNALYICVRKTIFLRQSSFHF